MLVKCSFCQSSFDCKPSRYKRSKNVFCSTVCHDLFRKRQTYQRLTKKIGEDLKSWLEKKYLNEMLPASKISKILYGKPSNKSHVITLLRENDIPIRQGSEAIKSQWVNNDKRKSNQAKIAKEKLNDDKTRAKLRETMQTEQYRINTSIPKRGNNNPMYGVVGEAHPNWNSDYDSETNVLLRKDVETVRWRKKVFERDDYTCVKCNDDTGGNLIAHHKNGWHWDVENRYNIDNGGTLCKNCHVEFHTIYGYRNNTEKQFDEFLALSL